MFRLTSRPEDEGGVYKPLSTIDEVELEDVAQTTKKEIEVVQESEKIALTPRQVLRRLALWTVINIFSTVAIVFTNKSIFSHKGLSNIQLSFAGSHFLVTYLLLHLLSTPKIAVFTRKPISLLDILPLAAALSANVVLPNFTLAYTSITFYQTVRVLLSPTVALINFAIYRKKTSWLATLTFIPVCVGVAMLTVFDIKSSGADANTKKTTMVGVVLGFAGVVASSTSTVFVSGYGEKLQMSSQQLLHRQAPVAACLVFLLAPFTDTLPSLDDISPDLILLLVASALLACLVNLSSFNLIAHAGPVSSTIIVHSKTCLIVSMSWIFRDRYVNPMSVLGASVAIAGIVAYSSIVSYQARQKSQARDTETGGAGEAYTDVAVVKELPRISTIDEHAETSAVDVPLLVTSKLVTSKHDGIRRSVDGTRGGVDV